MDRAETLIRHFQAIVDLGDAFADLQKHLEEDYGDDISVYVSATKIRKNHREILEYFRKMILEDKSSHYVALRDYLSGEATMAALSDNPERALRCSALVKWIDGDK